MADKRRVRVSAANLKHSHLYVTGLRDFFPPEVIGGSRRKNANGHGFDLILDGLGETVRTDIGSDGKNGKACFLRCRAAIGKFFSHHAVQPGGYVELQRLDERTYRLGLAGRARPTSSRASGWCGWRWNGQGSDVVKE